MVSRTGMINKGRVCKEALPLFFIYWLFISPIFIIVAPAPSDLRGRTLLLLVSNSTFVFGYIMLPG